MRSLRFTKKIFATAGIGTLAMAAIFLGVFMNSRTSDASVAGWNAGYIISDYVFTHTSTMNVSTIQAFLNNKVPSCDTWGTRPSEFGGGTRRQWAEAHGYHAPFTCLRDYRQGGKSAAQIIYEVAQRYDINPQVLLVLLQKEQGLVADTWPLSIQYRSATGYGCPDHAACDTDYYGFTNQVNWAAKMFRAILNDSPTWFTPYELGINYIQYNPDASCGGSNVNIRNRATQALYNYTPYQPNSGSLNAGWGTTHCGSYGNRNFYLYFTSWFGSTTVERTFTSLNDPRWLELSNDARKVDPLTGQEVDGTLGAGRQIRFTTKTSYKIDGEECLRTETDTQNGQRKCILVSDLKEVDITPTPIAEKKVRATARTFKRDLRRGTIRGGSIYENRVITVSGKVTVGGTDYYVTKHDKDTGIEYGILGYRFDDTSVYEDITPKYYSVTSPTPKVIPTDGSAVSGNLSSGLKRFFTSRTLVGGVWYYRTEHDDKLRLDMAVPESKLSAVDYEPFDYPRWMEIKNDTTKMTPLSRGTTSTSLSGGLQLKFVSKVFVDGMWYFRTAADTGAGFDKSVAAKDVQEISYQPFVSPRKLTLSRDAAKHVPYLDQTAGSTFTAGLTRYFSSKIYIDGTWYYRTEHDANHRINLAFKASDLEEAH